MVAENMNIDVVEEVRMVFHRVARGEEDHDFLVEVLLDEGEQKTETHL
jgi:rubrerythrin